MPKQLYFIHHSMSSFQGPVLCHSSLRTQPIAASSRSTIWSGGNVVCKDDQSEPLCICLATIILFCLTDV